MGTEAFPDNTNCTITIVNGIEMVRTVPLSRLQDEWHDKNNVSYNQILLCITSEYQMAIDSMDIASEAWSILTKKFESNDPSKINIVRMRYENYYIVKGQSVSYLTTMKEYRRQLRKMGEMIADSTHAATLLINVPESWRTIDPTIQMITRNLDEIEERLEAHKADLNSSFNCFHIRDEGHKGISDSP